ncbi:MAG: hypothetical protein L6R39_004173 [Caloplaca ligustica]|nr:MAG: hypothetical protein L6R39_004173 [Caloplaca ligustica]
MDYSNIFIQLFKDWRHVLTVARPVYIFVGSILLHQPAIRIIAGSIIGIVGVGYVILEYIPQIEPPQNMREAGSEWGAEQI